MLAHLLPLFVNAGSHPPPSPLCATQPQFQLAEVSLNAHYPKKLYHQSDHCLFSPHLPGSAFLYSLSHLSLPSLSLPLQHLRPHSIPYMYFVDLPLQAHCNLRLRRHTLLHQLFFGELMQPNDSSPANVGGATFGDEETVP